MLGQYVEVALGLAHALAFFPFPPSYLCPCLCSLAVKLEREKSENKKIEHINNIHSGSVS